MHSLRLSNFIIKVKNLLQFISLSDAAMSKVYVLLQHLLLCLATHSLFKQSSQNMTMAALLSHSLTCLALASCVCPIKLQNCVNNVH